MNIRIIGSMRFYDDMMKFKADLERGGHTVYTPIKFHGDSQGNRKQAIDRFRDELELSDAVLVVNKDTNGTQSYSGIDVAIEIGMSVARRKRIFMYQEPVGPVADYYQAIGYETIERDLRRIA